MRQRQEEQRESILISVEKIMKEEETITAKQFFDESSIKTLKKIMINSNEILVIKKLEKITSK